MRRAADNQPPRASLIVPYPLSDEAAATLIKLLHEVTEALESQYAEQLRRNYQPTDRRQAGFWNDTDPPF